MNRDPEYIEYEDAEKALLEIPDGPDRRIARAAIYKNNCVVKYRAADERSIEALKQGKLFFSSAMGYNDPYDTLMYINYNGLSDSIGGNLWHFLPSYGEQLPDKTSINYLYSKIYDGLPKEKKAQSIYSFLSHIREDAKAVIKELHDNVPGICFAKDSLSPLMWAHYADKHKGFALLYDRKELETAACFLESGEQVLTRRKLYNVEYRIERPDGTEFVEQYLLHQHLKGTNTRYRFLHGSNPVDSPVQHPYSQTKLKEIILAKSEEWSYEHETRLLFRPVTIEKEWKKRYLEIKPRAIILGARMDDEQKKVFTEIAKTLGSTLYEAWLDEQMRDYKVVFQEVR